MSAIEWTNETWNPVAGCSIVSTECKNCYAMRQAHRLAKMGQEEKYGGLTEVVNGHVVWNGVIREAREDLHKPRGMAKPRMIFVNSMSDLFHEGVSWLYLEDCYNEMEHANWHTYQILTKRADRMAEWTQFHFNAYCQPPKHIWHGASVGYKGAKDRIDQLRDAKSAVRFLSCEPLLEDLGELDLRGIHWVIIGGESGTGARPMNQAWARNIIQQCRSQNVAVFVKQMGKNFDLYRHGKGGDMKEWPADLRIREWPHQLQC